MAVTRIALFWVAGLSNGELGDSKWVALIRKIDPVPSMIVSDRFRQFRVIRRFKYYLIVLQLRQLEAFERGILFNC